VKRRSLIIGTSGLATTLATIATNSSIANAARGRIVNIGNDLKGYLVAPNSRQKAPAIIVLIEAFGLNNNIKNFCDRFAHAGYVAIAPRFISR
jgi:carboxymethylenebutenolidase